MPIIINSVLKTFLKPKNLLIYWFCFVFFKVEEERSKVASVLREKQELHEKWVEIERKLEKIQHEFSVKEAQNRAMQVMCLYPRTKSYYLLYIRYV